MSDGRVRRVLRYLFTTTPNEVRHETWTCPVCGLPVEIPSTSPPAARRAGLWLPPTPTELRAACERQHGSKHPH